MRDRPSDSVIWGGGATVTWWLIGLNVVIWFVTAGAARSGDPSFYDALALTPRDITARGHVWQFFSAMWLHDPVADHLLVNMIMLFLFGRMAERDIGSRSYLALYVVGGLASTLAAFGASYLFQQPDARIIGASGCVFAVMVFMGLRQPNRVVQLFGIWPIRLGVLVIGLMVLTEGLQLVKLWRPISTAGHLAGAAYGLLHLRLVQRGGLRPRRRRRGRKQELGPPREIPPPSPTVPDLLPEQLDPPAAPRDEASTRARVDELLNKISADGIGSLSEEEKQFLERASKEYR